MFSNVEEKISCLELHWKATNFLITNVGNNRSLYKADFQQTIVSRLQQQRLQVLCALFSQSNYKALQRSGQFIIYWRHNTSTWTNKTYNGEQQKHLNSKLTVRVSPWIIYKPLQGWWVYSTYFYSFWNLFKQGPHAKQLSSSSIMGTFYLGKVDSSIDPFFLLNNLKYRREQGISPKYQGGHIRLAFVYQQF